MKYISHTITHLHQSLWLWLVGLLCSVAGLQAAPTAARATGVAEDEVAPPVFAPAQTTFYDPIEVKITAADGCKIFYTLNGTAPSADNGTEYIAPIRLVATTTVTAVAIDESGAQSQAVQATYTCTKHGIGEGYNPSNPPDPAQPDQRTKYSFYTLSNPSGMYTSHATVSKYAAGEKINVYTYDSNGFVFENWTLDGQPVSTSSSFTYTMPERDVALIANYRFMPANPNDPDQPAIKHPLTVRAEPRDGGYFNFSSTSVTEGAKYDIYAYPNSDYRFTGWEIDGVKQPDVTSGLIITMGEKPMSVVGHFEFNPQSPTNPGANLWNPSTGQVIIDDFETGNLSSAVSQLVGSANYPLVTSILVKGKVNDYDFGVFRNSDFTVLSSVDITRIDGINNVPSYGFSDSRVYSLYLPASITSMGYDVFYNCANLTHLSVYATVPPKVNSYTFEGFTNKDNCVLHVPTEAIPLYEAAAYWKDFTIMPLSEELHALQVSLPETCSDGRYRNNRIELVNIASGARQKYVVTDRLLYTFIGLQKDEQYNVYLFSPNGLEIGKIENITIGDTDLAINFSNLKHMVPTSALVLNDLGDDLTQQVSVEWYEQKADASLTFLKRGAAFGDVPAGQRMLCRVVLPREAAMTYQPPADLAFTATEGQTACTVQLMPLRRITLNGLVTDENGAPLNGAGVSIRSLLAGQYDKSQVIKTDKAGRWTATVLEAPKTLLTYSANECINVRDTLLAPAPEVSTIDLAPVAMRSIVGARIQYDFTYRSAVKAGAEAKDDFYGDYNNVVLTAYDVTQQRALPELSQQYPQLVVLDETVAPGDVIRLTAHSTIGAFADLTAEVTLDDSQRAALTFALVGKGGILADYAMTENMAVTAMLYNAQGRLVKQTDYAEAAALFSALDAGHYTLVSIGKSQLTAGIQSLAALTEVGLQVGTDYVASDIDVTDGFILETHQPLVPAFDENRFRYTSQNSTLTLNKSSLTIGNYLTVRSAVDFRSIYKSGIKNVSMVYDLPANSEMVTGSVMRGSEVVPYELNGQRLTVPLGDNVYSQPVRFVVTPTASGTPDFTASVQFDYNGVTLMQPLGSTRCEVKDMEINVPHMVRNAHISVNGLAPAQGKVRIYDGETLIGETQATGGGTWMADCQLADSFNLGKHRLYATVNTVSGLVLQSPVREVTVDRNAIYPKTVVMTFLNDWMHRNIDVTFDFTANTVSESSYSFYHATDFTFVADLSDNSPDVVSQVELFVYTSNGDVRKLNATYDANSDRWVAVSHFDSNSLPVNLSVNVQADTPTQIDADLVALALGNYAASAKDWAEEQSKLNEMLDRLAAMVDTEGLTPDDEQLIKDVLAEIGIYNTDSDGIPQFTEEQILQTIAETEELLKTNTLTSLDELINADIYNLKEELEGFKIYNCDGLTEQSLIDEGYMAFDKTDGTKLYILPTETAYTMVDFSANLKVIINLTPEDDAAKVRGAAGDDFAANMEKACNEIEEMCDDLRNKVQIVADAIETVTDALVDTNAHLGDKLADLAQKIKYLKKYSGNKFLLASLEFQFEAAAKAVKANDKIIKWLDDNLEDLTVGKKMGKAFGVFGFFMDIKSAIQDIRQVVRLYNRCLPCPDDLVAAKNIQSSLRGLGVAAGTFYAMQLGLDIAAIFGLEGGIFAAVPTGGSSLVAVGVSIGVFIANIAASEAYTRTFEKRIKEQKDLMFLLMCNKDDPDSHPYIGDIDGDYNGGNLLKDPGCPRPPFDNINPILDPSGYVYEAVPENRLPGVQASVYYKEFVTDIYGDLHENIVLWNAEEYAQHNPLFTNEQGLYSWDVPQGLWQVKFEKNGYQTTFSEWLPVPPPQLEVNIGMTQNSQPEIVDAHAYEDGVEISFDKYMDPATLTLSNVFVTAGGTRVDGRLTFVSTDSPADSAPDAPAPRYVKTVRFVPAESLAMSTGEIRLSVSQNVRSYAGIPMAANYSQVFDIEKEIKQIATDERVQVLYGGEKQIVVNVIPFDAAVGKTLLLTNSSQLIASTATTEVVIDQNGQAVFTVKGLLPGQAALLFSVDGTSVQGQTVVSVVKTLYEVGKPVASRASGTKVYRGTKVKLSTDTPNATIYYTLDGSCPCDADGTRMKYTLPIEVNGDTHIKAYVVTNENEESETVELNYALQTSDIDYTMHEGWTWISHNLDAEVAPADLADPAVERIVGQRAEVVRDPQLGLVGTLRTLESAESYKVESAQTTAQLRLSDVARNPEWPIQLSAGWNWLGYPVAQTMTVAEALANTPVTTGDLIVGQQGFAQYNGTEWEGDLATLNPGAGYMYHAEAPLTLTYRADIVSNAASLHVQPVVVAPWAIDIHKYPQVMCVAAELVDADGLRIPADNYLIGAFCQSECRGIGKAKGNKLMLTVYGQIGDPITFRALPAGAESAANAFALADRFDFAERIVGSVMQPYPLRVEAPVTSLTDVNASGCAVSVNNRKLFVKGIDLERVAHLSLISAEGIKVLSADRISSNGLSLAHLTDGVYVVVLMDKAGQYSYFKILLK